MLNWECVISDWHSERLNSMQNLTIFVAGFSVKFEQKKMLARLSFTDFDGEEFMNKIEDNQKIDNEEINKFAPKIVEGVDKLKKWSESI